MKSFLLFCFVCFDLICFSQPYLMPIYSATSLQSSQPGDELSNAFDADVNSVYHSTWGQNGIPDELVFYFTSEVNSINQIVYTPRQSGLNGVWTNVNVLYSTQSNPNTFTQLYTNLVWNADNTIKILNLASDILNPYAIKFEIIAAVSNYSSCAEMEFFSDDPINALTGIDCSISTTELNINGANDIKATVITAGSSASSYQSGEDISKCFDGDLNTLYHSSWSNTVFPVELIFHFDGLTPMDYLKYIPRSDGGWNGNFGQVQISYNTNGNATYVPLLNFDFDLGDTPKNVYFPMQITPANIKIVVLNGVSNFASCAEMEFYELGNASNPIADPSIFANNLCSALQNGVTQTQINAITSPFYQSLAQCLYDQTYDLNYRVQTYEAYPTVNSISDSLKIGTYDQFENPTGILFENGTKIALFAENIPSTSTVQLAVKDFESSFDGVVSYYEIHNGLNVFNITNKGLGYINYYSNQIGLSDVNIHIVSGKINGYFDVSLANNTNWTTLLSNPIYPKVDLIGEFVHLVYDKDALQIGSPFDGNHLVKKYDTIVRHERMLMGLFKYNKSPKNRQLTYTEHGGGWWAGGLGVHLDLDWGIESITNPNLLDHWGIPHEYGHVNQIRPDLNWIGTTEVTNNFYSVWVDYHMNHDNDLYTRLEREEVAPFSGINNMEGGRFNTSIYNTKIQNEALQGHAVYDVFQVLVPFWQLQLYYQLSGAARNAPILDFSYPGSYTGIDYANWYGTVAEVVRNSNQTYSNGEYLLNFVKNTCDAVQEDLTDFFEKTGFLKPIDIPIDDYGIEQMTITQQQIDDTKAYIQSKGYQQPVSPVIEYISAHSINAFKNQLPLSGQTMVGVSLTTDYLLIDNDEWDNAVAFETFNANGDLLYVSIVGTNDLSLQTSKVYFPTNAYCVYAVGFDGQKILVYPAVASLNQMDSKEQVSLSPNPLGVSQELKISLPDGMFNLEVLSLEGKLISNFSGDEEFLNFELNKMKNIFQKGLYLINVSDDKNHVWNLKLVIED